MKNRILTHRQIQHKINRIAHQIYEANIEEDEIIIAGVEGGGLNFAEKIAAVLKKITMAKIGMCKVDMDKKNPLKSGVRTSMVQEVYSNKSIVLVDDVLDSGTTLIYGVHHFLKTPIKQLKTAILVNRDHKKYPIKADYKGISLSTSLHEHVRVEFESQNYGVYLE